VASVAANKIAANPEWIKIQRNVPMKIWLSLVLNRLPPGATTAAVARPVP
jgi:hypothetical protein